MPKLILNCHYYRRQKRRLENLIYYIAARDGAELVKSTKGYLTASGKQKMVISEIIREILESGDLYDYNDYKKHPTTATSSILLRRGEHGRRNQRTDSGLAISEYACSIR